jgi:hypothetical protein
VLTHWFLLSLCEHDVHLQRVGQDVYGGILAVRGRDVLPTRKRTDPGSVAAIRGSFSLETPVSLVPAWPSDEGGLDISQGMMEEPSAEGHDRNRRDGDVDGHRVLPPDRTSLLVVLVEGGET